MCLIMLVALLCGALHMPVAEAGVRSAQTAASATAHFGLDSVVARAQELARSSFGDSHRSIPGWLLDLNYDEWRDIRFRPEKALWHGQRLLFEVQFFHPGFLYDRSVDINIVDRRGQRPVRFSKDMFDYGKNDFAHRVPPDLGLAGFRLHYPLNRRDYKDELIVFLGASYFRAVSKGLGFGISARGLAIDTALPQGEEFPFFREFWLVRPEPGAQELRLYALLDAPRVTGAYQFTVRPGEQTLVDVEARVFLRREVDKLGVAPFTSMFYRGENSPRTVDDYRPEVHDSDGLLIANETGEWIWRPLRNPHRLQISTFAVGKAAGFGLLQRDRNFDHYQDLETRREARPSVWIEPRVGFPDGYVELVEIPTHSDTNDNIVAYWVLKKVAEPGQPLAFAYRMHWYERDDSRSPGGRAVATREAPGPMPDVHRVIVDFAGGRLQKLSADTVLRGVVTFAGGGSAQAELIEQQVLKNMATGGWRLVFLVRLKAKERLDMRAFLQLGDEALTETWTYSIEP